MNHEYIPKFELDLDNPDKVKESLKFHNRIIEFTSLNISGEIDSEMLCYFVDDEGFEIAAGELPRNAYKQALTKSLQFFTEEENYEKCKEVKELIEKI